MADRYAPVFIFDPASGGRRLDRVPYETPDFDEGQLQEILRLHPELLAIEQIESIYAPAVCVGREIAASGRVDNLYISPQGYITVIETKLWKNPGARREVVAQIIEYAKELAKRTYADLEGMARDYIRKYFPSDAGCSLPKWVESQSGQLIDETQFIDAASRCLRTGRFLLLIVGEGIRETAIDLVEHVNTTPELGYNLNLVEIGCYRDPRPDKNLVLVPRVIASTERIERAVVRIELSDAASATVKVQVSTPTAASRMGEAGGERETTPTSDEFFDQLEKSVGRDNSQSLRDFTDRLQAIGVSHRFTKQWLIFDYVPHWTGSDTLKLLSLRNDGRIGVESSLRNRLPAMGLPISLATDFWTSLHGTNGAFPTAAELTSAIKSTPLFDVSKIIPNLRAIETVIRKFTDDVEFYAEQHLP